MFSFDSNKPFSERRLSHISRTPRNKNTGLLPFSVANARQAEDTAGRGGAGRGVVGRGKAGWTVVGWIGMVHGGAASKLFITIENSWPSEVD